MHMAELITQRPEKWSVDFHCFNGYVLSEGECLDEPGTSIGFAAKRKLAPDAWLPYGIDLRTITEIKQNNPEMDATALYVNREYACTVNARVDDLMMPWIRARRSAAKDAVITPVTPTTHP